MRQFGELEAAIMDRLWERRRPALVREIVDDLHEDRPLAYTTVMTAMENLRARMLDLANQDARGRGHRRVSQCDHRRHQPDPAPRAGRSGVKNAPPRQRGDVDFRDARSSSE
jgi:predicted transcriptional regulator